MKGLTSQAPGTLYIKWGDKISTIHLDVSIENFGRLNGLSLAWACVDEADKSRRESMDAFFEELIIRISDPYPGRNAQINVTGAPELNGWLAEFFNDNSAEDRKLFKWSMMQNKMLSEQYKLSILSTIPKSKQPAWVHGEFMHNSDGLVYDEYDPILNNTNLTISDLHEQEDIWVTWDINNGGCNAYALVHRGKFTFIIKEWPKLQSTDAVIEKVKMQPWAHRAILTCDPACTQVFPYIQKSNLKHKIMTAAPPIEWRVTSMNIGFGTEAEYSPGVFKRRLLVNVKECKILNKCLMRQGYIKGVPDKKTWISEANTDISGPLDGVGYAYYYMHPFRADGIRKQISIRGF